MPLTLEELEDARAEAMADDIEIDLAKMSLWSRDAAVAYFESGGTEEPTVDISDGTSKTKKKFPPIAPRKDVAQRDMGDFDDHQDKLYPGDVYKLDFPYSAKMLGDEAKFGSVWLTQAFRAFGSISPSNSVTINSIKEFNGGGAATKCILTVSYEHEEADRVEGPLQTTLFCKMPHGQANKREKYLCACIYRSDAPEVLFAQRYYRRVPVKAPRTYFADRSERSTNFLMITECLPYATEAEHPKSTAASLPAYKLQRAFSKFHDHYLATDPFRNQTRS